MNVLNDLGVDIVFCLQGSHFKDAKFELDECEEKKEERLG